MPEPDPRSEYDRGYSDGRALLKAGLSPLTAGLLLWEAVDGLDYAEFFRQGFSQALRDAGYEGDEFA